MTDAVARLLKGQEALVAGPSSGIGNAVAGSLVAAGGHPGLPLGVARMAHVLWTRVLKYNPRNPFHLILRRRFSSPFMHDDTIPHHPLEFPAQTAQSEELPEQPH